MLKKIFYNRKIMVPIFLVIIIGLTLVAFFPMIYTLIMGSGVKTEPINAERTSPASTELDGTWEVVQGNGHNYTSVGFTFAEILPAEQTVTSGSTKDVTGQAKISDGIVDSAAITVNMEDLTTDKQVRDQNMKDKLFETSTWPTSTFELTEPLDLNSLPEDGSLGEVEVTGDLTIKDQTQSITAPFSAVRDGDTIVLGGDLPINRLDYNVITPDMIAAKIDEEGDVNIRLTLEKSEG